MDLCPAVSMLHALFYTVKSLSFRRGLPWFAQTACTLLANTFYLKYMLYLAVRQAYLTNHRLKASFMSEGYFNIQDCLVRKIDLAPLT